MKNIEYEIQSLLDIKQTVDNFNIVRKNSSIIMIPISQDYFNTMLVENKLNTNYLYCVFDKEIGQYIEGYLE